MSKVISASAQSFIVEPLLQGSSVIVQLAGPMCLHHQNIPGCSSWPELASTVRLPRQMQPLHSHLTNTAFFFMQATEERGIWKNKMKSFLIYISQAAFWSHCEFLFIFYNYYSMSAQYDYSAVCMTCRGCDRFWHKRPASVCLRVPTERLATCQLDAPAKQRRKCNCRPFISSAANSKPFSSPHHLGLILIFS